MLRIGIIGVGGLGTRHAQYVVDTGKGRPVAFADTEVAKAEAAAREKAEAEANACRQSVSCYGDKYMAAASVYCPDQIERLAKWDHEWTDGMLEMKFSHYRWKDKEAGIVDFIGDKLKMQNGFGAWQNVVYVCTFSTNPEMVLEVSAEPGRL